MRLSLRSVAGRNDNFDTNKFYSEDCLDTIVLFKGGGLLFYLCVACECVCMWMSLGVRRRFRSPGTRVIL